jgi:DNA ligase (NAD+)
MVNINILEEKYLKAKIAYYEGIPSLTDVEFDALEKILKEKGSKVIEQVGSKRKDFDFTHPTKMLSLTKEQMEATPEGTNYTEDSFEKWYVKRFSQLGKTLTLLSSPKLDGNAINIIFRGVKLANVLTRGDGFTGKDISKRFLNKIPQEIKLLGLEIEETDVIEIRCEVVIKTAIFNEKYASEFANPRNYVAGVIGKDEEDEIKISELDIIPLHYLVNGKHVSQSYFKLNDLFCNDINIPFIVENYVQVIKSYEALRETYKFQLDGVVISFPAEFREQLGENDHDPEWALAIKFVPQEAITPYEGIEWNISKRGEIIPTVLLKPILLDGSTVRRASGYNAGYIVDKKIGPGSVVSIAKAGDIIPEIQKVIVESTEDIKNILPQKCPSCSSPTTFDSIHLVCTNNNCIGKVAKQLSGAIKILEIQRIGEKTIEPFAKDFVNMYELIKWARTIGETPDGNIDQYGIKFGSRSHEIFIQAFKNIKSLTYPQVIQMLGYENVGDKLSTQLAREHAGLDFDYANLERALVAKLRDPQVSDYIKSVVSGLENLGIIIDRPKKTTNNISSIYICMTGSPKEFGFKTKEEFIKKFPGVEEVSISDKKCQYLITDSYSSKSSKMGIATRKGIQIKTYGDFKL